MCVRVLYVRAVCACVKLTLKAATPLSPHPAPQSASPALKQTPHPHMPLSSLPEGYFLVPSDPMLAAVTETDSFYARDANVEKIAQPDLYEDDSSDEDTGSKVRMCLR